MSVTNVQERAIERILSSNVNLLANEIHEKQQKGGLDDVGQYIAGVFQKMIADGIPLNKNNVFLAAGGTITQGYGNYAVPLELQEKIRDIGNSDYIEVSTDYQGQKYSNNSQIYEVEISDDHPLFHKDKHADWRIFAEMTGSKEGKDCELLGIHLVCSYDELKQSTMITTIAAPFIKNGNYAIHIPGKKYDPELKRLVIDNAAMNQNNTYNAAAILIMMMMEVEGAKVLDDDGKKQYGQIFTYSIATFLSQCNFNNSSIDVMDVAAGALRKMTGTSECIFYMNLINKIITDARDLITRIYSFVETSIRKSGYKFKSNSTNKGVVRTVNGNWYENFDPYKSKAYRELGVTRSKTKKGVNPYPSFHKLDVISFLNIAPESLNVLHSIKAKKYYISKSGIDAYNKVAGDVRDKMILGGYMDVSKLYDMARDHHALVFAMRESGETGLTRWIAERAIQLPLMVLTSTDLYVMKAVEEPSFVPLGYRSINALQEILLYSPVDNKIAKLPDKYYEDVYKFKKAENLQTETTAKGIVSRLLTYISSIAVSSPITLNDYRNRKTYNADKEMPSFNTQSHAMHKGIARYPTRNIIPDQNPQGTGEGNGGEHMDVEARRQTAKIGNRGQIAF